MNDRLTSLANKLNDTCVSALEAAGGLCRSRTHYAVEVEHVLIALLQMADVDCRRVLAHFRVDLSRLIKDMMQALDRFQTGSTRTPGLSPQLVRWMTDAWTHASLDFGARRIRSGHLLVTLLLKDDLVRLVYDLSTEWRKISIEDLSKNFLDILAGSVEDHTAVPLMESEPALAQAATTPTAPTKTPALDQYTVDLTARARSGQIDPVLGRDAEIRQVVDILGRRRQNNVILTGEAGVGKTAVVEGLALRIAAGDVPQPLKNVAIKVLDLALLQAGASMRGEFENRLKSVVGEVKASPIPIIVFIDEAHTLIGAGGAAGQGDAANILKPALARGELRTIAATTWGEYKEYFEKDPALTRRFQVVKVEEPDEAKAIGMMRGLVATLETHHKVRILDEAVEASVTLSHRYLSGRQLPDKSVSVLDTASARVALGQMATPPPVEDCQRRIMLLSTEMEMLARERAAGADFQTRLGNLAKEKAEVESRLAALHKQWQQEQTLIARMREIRLQLETGTAVLAQHGTPPSGAAAMQEEPDRLRTELARLTAELQQIQGECPLMQPCVDEQAVALVIAAWTGIPVGRMMKDEIATALTLKSVLEKRVVGQSHALATLSQRFLTARAKLEDPRRPIGVFLLVGPSGVGKTETALALADLLYGGEQHLTVINMSEFKEEHKVSLLMGAPPGYKGYGEGGVLTEAVRRKPHSIVLLDEMEKAHPGVQDIFYQVFDKGVLKDGTGRDIDFKNTVVIMTSNAGTETIMKLCADPETIPEPDGLVQALRPDLLDVFKPAFLGRTIVVPYYPISDAIMRLIVELQLGRITKRLREHHDAQFSYDPALVTTVAGRCTEVESGARNVDHILTKTLLPDMSREMLSRMAAGQSISRVHVTVGGDGAFVYEIG